MGVEVFGVSMRLIKPDVFDRVNVTLATFENVHMTQPETVAGFETIKGEYNDGVHLISLQLFREVYDAKCTLAARFSLCSYKTIDPIFVNLVNQMLSSFDAEVWLMTSALKQKANYLPGDTKWLLAALPDEIVAMREYWQQLFGKKQGCVRVEDSFSFVGLNVKSHQS
jgi:hypothetical protein